VKLDFISDISQVADNPEASRVLWNNFNAADNPFCRYEFLAALENSGCCTAETGWQPQHILVRDTSGHCLAAIPSYLKSNSNGEYVFDWAWADAYYRNGLQYYPKLLSAIPFTPSAGPRILSKHQVPDDDLLQFIRDAVVDHIKQTSISGWHMLFPDNVNMKSGRFFNDSAPMPTTKKPSGSRLQTNKQPLIRHGTQFHWFNQDYDNFAGFLADLTSRKRKNIRKEREKVAQAGVSCQWLPGPDIDDNVLEHFFRFYQLTYLKRGQQPYLNKRFFRQLLDTMPDQIHLLLAKHKHKIVAGSLFFSNEKTLYGRYWGCTDEFRHLHFECCYYQGIEFAIQQGLKHFDAGAQGEHKIQRGFEPIPTHSLHWITHPGFRAAIADFVKQEKAGVEAYMRDAETYLPFKQAQGD